MSTGDTTTTQGTTGTRQQGWLDGPVSRGLALTLLAANLVVMGGLYLRQSETLDRVEVGIQSLPPGGATPSVTADPELCWLVGSLAYASGQGEKLKTLLGGDATATPCGMDAARGAGGFSR